MTLPQSRPIGPHVLRTPVLLSEASLAHDVYVCLERPSGVLYGGSRPPGAIPSSPRSAEFSLFFFITLGLELSDTKVYAP